MTRRNWPTWLQNSLQISVCRQKKYKKSSSLFYGRLLFCRLLSQNRAAEKHKRKIWGMKEHTEKLFCTLGV